MQKEIHYEDNLFFIISQIEQLSQMLDLSLDGNFLCDKYILDVNFFDKILTKIETTIIENQKLINFLYYIQLMRKARGAMETLLITIQNSRKDLAIQFREKFNDELDEMIAHQHSRYRMLLNQLSQNNNKEQIDELETIGFEEMRLLIRQDFEDAEEDQES